MLKKFITPKRIALVASLYARRLCCITATALRVFASQKLPERIQRTPLYGTCRAIGQIVSKQRRPIFFLSLRFRSSEKWISRRPKISEYNCSSLRNRVLIWQLTNVQLAKGTENSSDDYYITPGVLGALSRRNNYPRSPSCFPITPVSMWRPWRR